MRGVYWLRSDDVPESWPVVVLSGEMRPQLWRFDGTAAAFVADLVEDKLDVPFGGRPDMSEPPFRQFEGEAPARRRGLGRLLKGR